MLVDSGFTFGNEGNTLKNFKHVERVYPKFGTLYMLRFQLEKLILEREATAEEEKDDQSTVLIDLEDDNEKEEQNNAKGRYKTVPYRPSSLFLF